LQWIKHMCDMVDDPKIRRLIRAHSALGYAVYNIVIERIGKRLSSDAPLPDLEETAEDIADLLNTDTAKVEEVMKTCLKEQLFEPDEFTGRILCSKIYKFLEKSQTRSPEIRAMISNYKEVKPKLLPSTVSDSLGQSHTVRDCPDRIDKISLEEHRKEEDIIGLKPEVAPPVEKPRKPSLPIEETTRVVIAYLNECAGTAFRDGAGNRTKVGALLKKGYTVMDMKKVIKVKSIKWGADPKMRDYLRPSTLFGPEKFDDYLGEYETEYARAKE